MNSTTALRRNSSPRSISSRNFLATENSELSGQGWNLHTHACVHAWMWCVCMCVCARVCVCVCAHARMGAQASDMLPNYQSGQSCNTHRHTEVCSSR